ncbi:3-isopropylmalate dehydratase small subunit [Vagococcus sp. BWB3-3]|uniref:3-isopropylmalate dehydratase small subunit n=1 Tax=Vagococcus allomyrinae TaxID=2794353 RepID=A0A940PIC8_9ENTE|nr:3-isopropylmalate dehydratase small subunit [Vagococcus allomyrinae]MBP1043448.1 3-isopropylmalate dehydratase small subunit [Vagococcus allomyrinae]
MEAIKIHQGQTVPLMNDNIDTDQIIPKSFLKRIEKTGFGKHLFDEWRFLADGSDNPAFILNQADRQKATILVTGDNFGCGSSREHAAWAIMDYRFRVVIAGSYSDIFYMNAIKNGLLPIVLPAEAREKLAAIAASEDIIIDLPAQEVQASVGTYHFEIDPMWKNKLINGLDDIAVTLADEPRITAYEATIPSYWS